MAVAEAVLHAPFWHYTVLANMVVDRLERESRPPVAVAGGFSRLTSVLSPLRSYHLADDASGTFERTPLWAAHVCRLLEPSEIDSILSLALAHAASHGWSTSRHSHHPTTDFAVDAAPALHAALHPLVATTILPTLARLYDFEGPEETLLMRDLFFVRYEAGAQDRLTPHRDGTLLSFNVLLSEPGRDFEGGGTRFFSIGDSCEACRAPQPTVGAGGGGPAGSTGCAHCAGTGRAALQQQLGDLTMHCGKLLHEGAPVVRGTRFVLVGFVTVRSPRVDSAFVEEHVLANTSKVGGWADHECVGNAYFEDDDEHNHYATREEASG